MGFNITPFDWALIALAVVVIGIVLWHRIGRARHQRYLAEREAALRRVRERQDAVMFGTPRAEGIPRSTRTHEQRVAEHHRARAQEAAGPREPTDHQV